MWPDTSKTNKKITVRVRLGQRPSFPHPQERHHPLGPRRICSSYAELSRSDPPQSVQRPKIPLTASTFPMQGHEFPIYCGSQHSWKNPSTSKQDFKPVPLFLSHSLIRSHYLWRYACLPITNKRHTKKEKQENYKKQCTATYELRPTS